MKNLYLIFVYSLWVMLLFYPVIFYSNIFGSGDTLNPYSINHILDSFKSIIGEWPLWQPWIFSGMPTLEAFTYVNELYFPTKMMISLGISDLNIQLLHLIFSGFGMYLFLIQLNLSRSISFAIGLLWMLNPYLITMIVYGHGSQMMTAAYFPWILYALNRLKDSLSVESIALLAMLLGFQLQRGHVQIAYYSFMLCGVYFVYNYFVKKDNRNIFLMYFIIACGAGFLLASHIYYPSLDYLSSSIRAGGENHYQYATNWSMHPKELLTYIMPYYYGFGGSSYNGYMPFTDYPNYVGIFVLCAAFFSVFRLNSQKVFFSSILALSILLSFGKYFNFLYDFFYSYFPFFKNFRVPSMILIVSNFILYILAAFGLSDMLKSILKKDRFKKIQPRSLLLLFLAISLLDIFRIDKNIISPKEGSGQKSQIISSQKFDSFFIEDEAIIFLKNDSDLYRVYPAGDLFQDPKLKFYGIESVGGYHPAKFRHYNNLLSETNNLLSIPVLRFLNVKYLLSPVEVDHKAFELALQTPYSSAFGTIDLNIYRLKNNLERAWFIKNIIKEDASLYNYLTANAFDPENMAVVEGLDNQSVPKGEVLNINWDIHNISIDVNVESEKAFLVLSEINYPKRWKAKIDGEPTKIYQTNGVLRGILIDKGSHSVVFKYDDSLFKCLLLFSNMLLFIIFFILVKPFLMNLLKKRS